MIDWTKPVRFKPEINRTVGDEIVAVLATDMSGNYPVMCKVNVNGTLIAGTFTLEGSSLIGGKVVVENVPEKRDEYIVVVEYADGQQFSRAFPTYHAAWVVATGSGEGSTVLRFTYEGNLLKAVVVVWRKGDE